MTDQIVESTFEKAFQYGILGVLVFLFGTVIVYLYREWTRERKELLKDFSDERKSYEGKIEGLNAAMSNLQKEHVSTVERLQQLRIGDNKEQAQLRGDDAKAYQASLVDLTKGATTALQQVASGLDHNREALVEARDTMKEIGDDIRRRS